MEFVLNIISDLELIYKEVFWLKEVLLILQSFFLLAVLLLFCTLKQGEKLIIIM